MQDVLEKLDNLQVDYIISVGFKAGLCHFTSDPRKIRTQVSAFMSCYVEHCLRVMGLSTESMDPQM